MALLNTPRFRILAFLFFFLSGATGLIYEVVWTRLLTLAVGNTHYSVATVLTTFMAGLALGSYLGGRWVDRHGRPLLVYAGLEAAIGLYCLLLPHLIEAALPWFRWVYVHFQGAPLQGNLLRFLICAGLLIVPTTCMGATLPVLGKFVSRNPETIGRDVGTLYGINTFGAVLGAYASAWWLMRHLGISNTIAVAAGVNIAIGGGLWWLLRREPAGAGGPASGSAPLEDVPHPAEEPPLSRGERLLLTAFALSGMTALTYQIAWNRIFSLVLGSSVYAFSLILTTFVLGLALGTLVFSRMIDRLGELTGWFGLLQLGIGLSALAGLPAFGFIPLFNRWVYLNWGQDFSVIQWANFLVIFSFIFLPTFFMGAQFPVVLKNVARRLDTLGRRVGLVYASNTLGTIVGSFAAGFYLIPRLGIQNTLWCAVWLNVLIGTALLAFSRQWSLNIRALVLPGVLLIVYWAAHWIPPWDRAVISSGSFMPYRLEDLEQALEGRNKILFYKEGVFTTVTVELAVTGNIFLRVNGKTDASLAADMRTQLLSGYLPMLFHPRPRNVLVVGQGSGVTLGAVEYFPARDIDLVEISPAVIEGSRWFGPFNHQALDDPRVKIILEDGRNHVTLTGTTYDVIISEPSNPWISGVGALFTRDFYQRLYRRLNPGGIACVWIHTNMSPESFKSIVRAYTEVFPFVTLWESIVGDDYLLIGSGQPYRLPYEATRDLLGHPDRGRELARLGIQSVRDLMGLYLMDREGLTAFSRGAPVHTDDNSLLEFAAPEYIYKDERDVIVRELTPYFGPRTELIGFSRTDEETRKRVRAEMASLERTETQVKEIRRRAAIDQRLDEAAEAFNRGALEQAARLYQEILQLDPDHILAYYNLGNVYRSAGEPEKALAAYGETVRRNPYYVFGYVAMAQVYLGQGRGARAREVLVGVLDWLPEDAEVHTWIGLTYHQEKKTEEAREAWRTATRLDSRYAPAFFYLGVSLAESDPRQARQHLKWFLRLAEKQNRHARLAEKARQVLKKL